LGHQLLSIGHWPSIIIINWSVCQYRLGHFNGSLGPSSFNTIWPRQLSGSLFNCPHWVIHCPLSLAGAGPSVRACQVINLSGYHRPSNNVTPPRPGPGPPPTVWLAFSLSAWVNVWVIGSIPITVSIVITNKVRAGPSGSVTGLGLGHVRAWVAVRSRPSGSGPGTGSLASGWVNGSLGLRPARPSTVCLVILGHWVSLVRLSLGWSMGLSNWPVINFVNNWAGFNWLGSATIATINVWAGSARRPSGSMGHWVRPSGLSGWVNNTTSGFNVTNYCHWVLGLAFRHWPSIGPGSIMSTIGSLGHWVIGLVRLAWVNWVNWVCHWVGSLAGLGLRLAGLGWLSAFVHTHTNQ